MTLEDIQYKLQGLVNQISSQNESHYNLNQNILVVPPEPDNKQESVGVSPPEGLVTEIYKLIWRLEKEADFQSYNVNRTREIVHSPTVQDETPIKGY